MPVMLSAGLQPVNRNTRGNILKVILKMFLVKRDKIEAA